MLEQLSFGICWFNDPSIFRLLDSLPSKAKKYVIDGKFEFNPNPDPLSNESLRDGILEYENIELIDAPNLPEPRKREMYLIDNPYKFLFIIDSDEYIKVAEWDRFDEFIQTLPEGIHDIFFEVSENGDTSAYPRLWVNPKDWRYTMCHNIFKNDKLGVIQRSGSTYGKTCPGVLCSMDDRLRSESHLKDTFDYQVKMMEFEKPFRHQFRDGDLKNFL